MTDDDLREIEARVARIHGLNAEVGGGLHFPTVERDLTALLAEVRRLRGEATWVEQPTEAGWWWFEGVNPEGARDKSGVVMRYVFSGCDEFAQWDVFDEMMQHDIADYSGKWQRISAPTAEELHGGNDDGTSQAADPAPDAA